MQSLGLAGMLIAYGALAALLLSVCLYSTWHWWVKAAATLGLLLIYSASYLSVPPLLGWPIDHNIPRQFRLLAFTVEENKGIYIWASDLNTGVDVGTPRAHMLPYSKLLHTDIQLAGARLKRGINIIGEVTTLERSPSTQTADEGPNRKTVQTVTFLDAPEGLIPN